MVNRHIQESVNLKRRIWEKDKARHWLWNMCWKGLSDKLNVSEYEENTQSIKDDRSDEEKEST